MASEDCSYNFYLLLKMLNMILMVTYLSVLVYWSRQMVLEVDKGDNSRSDSSSSLLESLCL